MAGKCIMINGGWGEYLSRLIHCMSDFCDERSSHHQEGSVAPGPSNEETEYIDCSSVVKPVKSDLSGSDKQLWLFQFPSEVRFEKLQLLPVLYHWFADFLLQFDIKELDGDTMPLNFDGNSSKWIQNSKNEASYTMEAAEKQSARNMVPLVWNEESEKLIFGPSFNKVFTISRDMSRDTEETATAWEDTWHIDDHEPSVNGLHLGRSPFVQQFGVLPGKWTPIGSNGPSATLDVSEGDKSKKEKKHKKKKSKKEKK